MPGIESVPIRTALGRWKAKRQGRSTEPPSLLDYVPEVSPALESPYHLTPIAEALDTCFREPRFICLSSPPQHGKSELVFHAIARGLHHWPRSVLYITYSTDFAQEQMHRALSVARRAGLPFPRGPQALRSWRLENGGQLWATGVGSSITGRVGGVVIIDDLIKGWKEAQSRKIREHADNWLRSEVLTRLHPGSSVVLIATRWHEDDQIGRLAAEGWEVVNLPAINADGEALWPAHRPIDWLEEQRRKMTPLLFEALYQGRPQPDGGETFEPASYYEHECPPGRVAIGVDLAYTANTKADYSVAVVCVKAGNYIYIRDMIRRQMRAPDFAEVLGKLSKRYPGAPMRWYASGTEKGAADFIRDMGIKLKVENASSDKLVRAQPLSATWNDGRVLVPANATWASDLVNEVTSFTGLGDAHDDIVDALAAGHDVLEHTTEKIEYLGFRHPDVSGINTPF